MKKIILMVFSLMIGVTLMAQRANNGHYTLQQDTVIAYRVMTTNAASCFVDLAGLVGDSVKIELVVSNIMPLAVPYAIPSDADFLLLDNVFSLMATSDTTFAFWVDTPAPFDYFGIRLTYHSVTASDFNWKFKYLDK